MLKILNQRPHSSEISPVSSLLNYSLVISIEDSRNSISRVLFKICDLATDITKGPVLLYGHTHKSKEP